MNRGLASIKMTTSDKTIIRAKASDFSRSIISKNVVSDFDAKKTEPLVFKQDNNTFSQYLELMIELLGQLKNLNTSPVANSSLVMSNQNFIKQELIKQIQNNYHFALKMGHTHVHNQLRTFMANADFTSNEAIEKIVKEINDLKKNITITGVTIERKEKIHAYPADREGGNSQIRDRYFSIIGLQKIIGRSVERSIEKNINEKQKHGAGIVKGFDTGKTFLTLLFGKKVNTAIDGSGYSSIMNAWDNHSFLNRNSFSYRGYYYWAGSVVSTLKNQKKSLLTAKTSVLFKNEFQQRSTKRFEQSYRLRYRSLLDGSPYTSTATEGVHPSAGLSGNGYNVIQHKYVKYNQSRNQMVNAERHMYGGLSIYARYSSFGHRRIYASHSIDGRHRHIYNRHQHNVYDNRSYFANRDLYAGRNIYDNHSLYLSRNTPGYHLYVSHSAYDNNHSNFNSRNLYASRNIFDNLRVFSQQNASSRYNIYGRKNLYTRHSTPGGQLHPYAKYDISNIRHNIYSRHRLFTSHDTSINNRNTYVGLYLQSKHNISKNNRNIYDFHSQYVRYNTLGSNRSVDNIRSLYNTIGNSRNIHSRHNLYTISNLFNNSRGTSGGFNLYARHNTFNSKRNIFNSHNHNAVYGAFGNRRNIYNLHSLYAKHSAPSNNLRIYSSRNPYTSHSTSNRRNIFSNPFYAKHNAFGSSHNFYGGYSVFNRVNIPENNHNNLDNGHKVIVNQNAFSGRNTYSKLYRYGGQSTRAGYNPYESHHVFNRIDLHSSYHYFNSRSIYNKVNNDTVHSLYGHTSIHAGHDDSNVYGHRGNYTIHNKNGNQNIYANHSRYLSDIIYRNINHHVVRQNIFKNVESKKNIAIFHGTKEKYFRPLINRVGGVSCFLKSGDLNKKIIKLINNTFINDGSSNTLLTVASGVVTTGINMGSMEKSIPISILIRNFIEKSWRLTNTVQLQLMRLNGNRFAKSKYHQVRREFMGKTAGFIHTTIEKSISAVTGILLQRELINNSISISSVNRYGVSTFLQNHLSPFNKERIDGFKTIVSKTHSKYRYTVHHIYNEASGNTNSINGKPIINAIKEATVSKNKDENGQIFKTNHNTMLKSILLPGSIFVMDRSNKRHLSFTRHQESIELNMVQSLITQKSITEEKFVYSISGTGNAKTTPQEKSIYSLIQNKFFLSLNTGANRHFQQSQNLYTVTRYATPNDPTHQITRSGRNKINMGISTSKNLIEHTHIMQSHRHYAEVNDVSNIFTANIQASIAGNSYRKVFTGPAARADRVQIPAYQITAPQIPTRNDAVSGMEPSSSNTSVLTLVHKKKEEDQKNERFESTKSTILSDAEITEKIKREAAMVFEKSIETKIRQEISEKKELSEIESQLINKLVAKAVDKRLHKNGSGKIDILDIDMDRLFDAVYYKIERALLSERRKIGR